MEMYCFLKPGRLIKWKRVYPQPLTDTSGISIHILDFQVANAYLVKKIGVEVVWDCCNQAVDSNLTSNGLEH